MTTRPLPPDLALPTLTEPAGLAELAWRAATSAGALLLRGRGDLLEVDTKTSATDVVTQMDTRSEAAIVALIRAERPDDALLGEEGGERAGTSGVRWVVDPLDGTVNYTYGLPFWAVSIAAEVAGQTVVGVVDIPVIGETFLAIRGHGSYCVTTSSHKRLAVRHPDSLGTALVATGFGYVEERRVAQGRTIAQLLPLIRDIRRYGAAAVDLCAVAGGRVDAYFERGTHPWDFAAGLLIATEAGALAGGPLGQEPNNDLVWTICPELAPSFTELLTRFGADRD